MVLGALGVCKLDVCRGIGILGGFMVEGHWKCSDIGSLEYVGSPGVFGSEGTRGM